MNKSSQRPSYSSSYIDDLIEETENHERDFRYEVDRILRDHKRQND